MDSAQQTPIGAYRLLSLFASMVMAILALILLGIRPTHPAACVLAVYLMSLGVLARDNMAGLSTVAPFSFDIYQPRDGGYRPALLLWILSLGTAPLLFTGLYIAEDRPSRPRPTLSLVLLSMTLGFIFLQALCIYLASRGAFGLFALTELARRLPVPQHQLLLYAVPVLMTQHLIAIGLLWQHYRRWGESHNRATLLVFGIATLFVTQVIISNTLIRPATGIVSNLIAYLVPTAFVWLMERHALFDIRITIRKVVQYALARQVLGLLTLLPLLTLAFFVGLRFNPPRNLSGSWLDLHQALSRQGTLVCSVLAGAFAFMLALRVPLLHWFDRAYFREVYDAQTTLNRIGRSLLGLSDSNEIARRALEGIDGILHPVNAMIVAREETGITCLARRNHTGYRPPAHLDSALLSVDRVAEVPMEGANSLARAGWANDLPLSTRALLEAGQIRLLIPLVEEEQTVGILLLGEKASGMRYTPEDIDVLLALASQISLALQSARLNREFLRQGTRELKARSADFIEQVERERRLLAADLHDQTLPELRSLLNDLETLAEEEGRGKREKGKEGSTLDTSIENQKSNIETPTPGGMAENLRTTIANIRDMMESLRPSALEMLGLLPALESELRKATGRARPPLIPQFRVSEEAQSYSLSAFEEVSVFRIMQEAVNNACRHASAETVCVTVEVEDDAWLLAVEDDGRGLPSAEGRQDGHGLDNIRYRAGLIGATVEWSLPESRRGTRIELRLPMRRRKVLV